MQQIDSTRMTRLVAVGLLALAIVLPGHAFAKDGETLTNGCGLLPGESHGLGSPCGGGGGGISGGSGDGRTRKKPDCNGIVKTVLNKECWSTPSGSPDAGHPPKELNQWQEKSPPDRCDQPEKPKPKRLREWGQ